MEKWINAEQIKDRVSLVDLLARLGHAPAYRSGKELFYRSMLREENTPSFCVNDTMDVWFDHGGPGHSGIRGGNVIDFGLAYWYPATFPEVLNRISNLMAIPLQTSAEEYERQKRPRQRAKRVANYRIETVREPDSHPAITRYLKSRGIWEAARNRVKEVYYSIDSGPKQGRQFFSAGWQNEAGGWELSNRIGDRDFKACLGRKAITFVPGDPGKVSLFEGYMDYLSWFTDNPEANDTVIVLNSVSLIDTAVDRARAYGQVNSSEHPLHLSNIEKLAEFQQYLATRDRWNIRPNDVLMKEKDGKIAELQARIQDLEEHLNAHTKYGVSHKVYVEDGYLPTLIDLIRQLREVELPNGRNLLKSDHHSPYYKLVAKYFNHGGKEIPLDTVRNYFVGKGEAPIKGSQVPEDRKLFRIVPADQA